VITREEPLRQRHMERRAPGRDALVEHHLVRTERAAPAPPAL